MTRHELILAAMSPARCGTFSPVQIQKLFFLIEQNISDQVDGPHFEFVPYHYGPFDKEVYEEIDSLAAAGLTELSRDGRWTSYRLTEAGQQKGEKALKLLRPEAQDFINRTTTFVRSLSFTKLVASIYKAYPEMRENSVFSG